MALLNDLVTAGDYKNADIKLKGLRADKVVLIHRTIFGKKEIKLDKSTIEKIEIKNQTVTLGTSCFQIEIIFKDGKKSLVNLTELMYTKLYSALY